MLGTGHFSETAWAAGRVRTLAIGLLAVTAALLFASLAAKPANASTFFVISTGDEAEPTPGDGVCDVNGNVLGPQCTLRAAIQESNASTSTDDEIRFFINPNTDPSCDSTTGVCTITPGSILPTLTDTVSIDGYTQGDGTTDTADDALENTSAQGPINAVLKIELSGQNAGTGTDKVGLAINAPNVVVKGLVINRFAGGGIRLLSQGGRIEGNFIGTNPAGDADLGNGFSGIEANFSANGQIGGSTPAARNLVSGNTFHGVNIGGFSTGYKVEGNLIGTSKDGTSALGNALQGVVLSGVDANTIGGTEVGQANVIAFNGGRGVLVSNAAGGGTGNRILSNSIFSNGGLGIDLQGGAEDANGVTANDPKDRDLGPNRLQNSPLITSAITSGGSTTIKGKLKSTPRKNFTIQFFSSTEADPSGFGEGEEFLGQINVKTSRKGSRSFTFTANQDLQGKSVTATATSLVPDPNDPATLLLTDTSEFSNAVAVS